LVLAQIANNQAFHRNWRCHSRCFPIGLYNFIFGSALADMKTIESQSFSFVITISRERVW